jgi:hypothetical protein
MAESHRRDGDDFSDSRDGRSILRMRRENAGKSEVWAGKKAPGGDSFSFVDLKDYCRGLRL